MAPRVVESDHIRRLRCGADLPYAFRSEASTMKARALCYLVPGILMLTAAGCDPVVSIAGANFPDWLLCAGAGALLAALCHPIFVATGLERDLRPLPLFYGGVIAMFALIGWVTFFSRA
jgi:YtcA-like protein